MKIILQPKMSNIVCKIITNSKQTLPIIYAKYTIYTGYENNFFKLYERLF